jgi:hypothetical protein
MSSEPVQAEAPPTQQDNRSSTGTTPTSPQPHSHRNITFTFPIVFINHGHPPPSSSASGNRNGNDPSDTTATPSQQPSQQHPPHIPPEDIPHLMAHLFRSMPISSLVAGQFEPIPTGPPKKHATQSAIDTLKPVDIATLPEPERRCHICMQDYPVKQVGPRTPYVEDVKDEEDILQDVSMLFESELTGEKGEEEDTVIPDVVAPSEEPAEVPVQMPCGHIFGSTCLKAWLYESPTCPLCRVEVESYTEDPQPPTLPNGFPGFPPFPWAHPPTSTPTQQSDEMQVDPQSPPNTENPPQPTVPQFGQLEFQFIFTAPPPSTPSPTTTTPTATTPSPAPSTRSTTPRPQSGHSIRHHPYARIPTPSPLSGPSVTDRPDLFCAQRLSGLCPHDHETDDHLLRLECGHAFHEDCLVGSMQVEGYQVNDGERRCPRCRRWMSVLQ